MTHTTDGTQAAGTPSPGAAAARIAALYALLAALWIAVSDRAVETLAGEAATLTLLQNYKGWAFVAVTALLLFLLMRAALARIAAARDGQAALAARYRELFAANPHPMWIFDRDTLRFLAVNVAAVKHYGYSAERFLAMTIADIRPPEDVAALRRSVEAAEGYGTAGIWRHRRADGSLIDVEITGHTLEWEGRAAELVLAHDVTEQLAARRALAGSERRLRLAVAAGKHGLWEYEVAGSTARVAAGFGAVLGYDDAGGQYLREDWSDLIHPDDRRLVFEHMTDCVEGLTEHLRHEFRMRAADGAWRWILAQGEALARDGAGRALDLIGTYTDISEQKRVQAELRHMTNLYATLSQANQVIVRTRDESRLYAEVCRVAVEFGGMCLAWVGLRDVDHDMVRIIACAGPAAAYLRKLRVSIDPVLAVGRGPTGIACREGRSYVCNDFLADPVTAPWHEEARRAGIAASAALPLRRQGEVVGCLNFYAAQTGYFDARTVALLEEMADDVSFVLDMLALDRARDAAEAALRVTRERLDGVLASVEDVLWSTTPDGMEILFISPSVERYSGLTAAAHVGDAQLWLDMVAPQDLAEMSARFARIAETGSYEAEYRLRRPGAEERWMRDRAWLVRGAGGVALRVDGITQDVTEQKRELDARERLVRERELVLNSISDGVIRLDGELRYVYLNARACELLRTEGAELIGRNVWEAFPEDRGSPFHQTCLKAMRSGRPQRVESYFAPWQQWFESRCYPFEGGLTIFTGDITVSKFAAVEREQLLVRLRIQFEAMPIACIVTDPDLVVREWNPAAERIFGYRRDEIVGRQAIHLVVPPEVKPRIEALLGEVLRGERAVAGENVNMTRDGRRITCDWQNVPLRDESGQAIGLMAMAQDVTERKTAQLRLQELSRRLLTVQEQERRALARELHDEMGQQMAALKLNLDMMSRMVGKGQDASARIADCAEIADRAIGQMRDTALDLRPAVLDDMGLAATLHWYARRQAERTGAAIVVNDLLPERLPAEIETAAFRIVQEAVNNALRHGAARKIRITVQADVELTLVIEDDGSGFDPDARAVSGFGLMGMRERAELLGGTFRLLVRQGKGVRIEVSIPMAQTTP